MLTRAWAANCRKMPVMRGARVLGDPALEGNFYHVMSRAIH